MARCRGHNGKAQWRAQRKRRIRESVSCTAVAQNAQGARQVHSTLAEEVRADFPILQQSTENGSRFVYLDSAATSQKPTQVTDALTHFYATANANVHRGVHYLAALATSQYESARTTIARFIGAPSDREIVFTRNATEAINLIANSWGEENIEEGDEIVLSVMEHHANLVPWQMLAKRKGAVLRFADITADGRYDMDSLKRQLNSNTKLVGVVHVSNTLGCFVDIPQIAEAARSVGARLLVDACQSVPHMPIDVTSLGCDFMVASGHKMLGPTGVGFVYASYDLLEQMPPWQGGGEMIDEVYLEHSTYSAPPLRFEAGTPAYGEAVGLAAAVKYLEQVGMQRIQQHEAELAGYMYEKLSTIEGIEIYGPTPSKGRAGLVSFNVRDLHANDVTTLVDQHGVGIRSGHQCTQPLHRHLGINATARASVHLYNTAHEVDELVQAVADASAFFADVGL